MSLERGLNVKSILIMATLKISDLSVGDWVMVEWPNGERWRGRLTRLSETGGIEVSCANGKHVRCTSKFISSIPITAEILEKNGLFRHEIDAASPERVTLSNYFMLVRTYTDVDWWRVLIYDEEIASEELFNGIVYSVHQLQHALRLAEVDKEINL